MRRNILPLALMGVGVLLIAVASIWALQVYSNPTPTLIQGSEDSYPDIARISLADAKQAHDRGQAVFIDVREEDAYNERHIAGAISIPLSELPLRLGELDPDRWYITYCA